MPGGGLGCLAPGSSSRAPRGPVEPLAFEAHGSQAGAALGILSLDERRDNWRAAVLKLKGVLDPHGVEFPAIPEIGIDGRGMGEVGRNRGEVPEVTPVEHGILPVRIRGQCTAQADPHTLSLAGKRLLQIGAGEVRSREHG